MDERDENLGHPRRRRGASAAFTVVFLPVLFGMAALTVDVACLYSARTDLQRTADTTALSGARALTTDAMMQLRMGTTTAPGLLVYAASARAGTMVGSSAFPPGPGTLIGAEDVTVGWLDLRSAAAKVQSEVPPDRYNAVRVTARRTAESAQGPLALFLARLWGVPQGDVTAAATAVLDDRAAGFDTRADPGRILPFTVDQAVFASAWAYGPDRFAYNSSTEVIHEGGDGVREIRLYPHDNPASFGLLNIGGSSRSAPDLRGQIENGLRSRDVELELGTCKLTFHDPHGRPVTYKITGDPGLTASLESGIETRTGQVVGFFLHDAVTPDGAAANYNIVGLRFARLMRVSLDGASASRGIWVQPVTYTGSAVQLHKRAPSSGGLLGRIVLAR